MNNILPNDRREHTRTQFNGLITLYPVRPSKSGHILELEPDQIMAQAQDISESGIRFEVDDSDFSNDILKISFYIQNLKLVDVYAQLAWKDNKVCGLQFKFLDNLSRGYIRDYVENQKNEDLSTLSNLA
jgi:hypothetical protein